MIHHTTLNECNPSAEKVQNNADALELFNRESIRRAFRAWDSARNLGELPLAQLKAVKLRCTAAGYTDTPAGRGLALRDILLSSIESLRPTNQTVPYDKRWRHYTILNSQFVHGRTPDCVADDLSISRRTYYNEQELAMEKVGEILRQLEAQASLQNAQEISPSSQFIPEEVNVPFLAPSLPAHSLVGRESTIETLKSILLDGKNQPILTLQGLPGIGKTALAIVLSNDAAILNKYSGGVLWAGLGRQPDTLALLGLWASALGISNEELSRLTTPSARARAVHSAIGTRPFCW